MSSPMTLIAEFPLGVFQGRRGDGASRDPYPDAARLHSALMHAAGKGSTAIVRDGDLRPSPDALSALTWLEENPPSALAIPEHVSTHHQQRLVAYRNEGLMTDKGRRVKTAVANLRARTALASPVGWHWDNVPDDVRETIGALAADVSCLGEADAPVVLTFGAMAPTHFYDPTASAFSVRDLTDHRCPAPGRVAALERDYEDHHPAKRPASKPAGADENSVSPANVGHTRQLRYRPVEEAPVASPWASVWVFDTRATIAWERRVTMSVAFHRMLATRLGDNASPWITGDYVNGALRPANRIAIQVLDRTLAPHLDLTGDAFLVLIPQGMDADVLRSLDIATIGSLRVYTADQVVQCSRTQIVAADQFWPAAAAGTVRLWSPVPGMVSETRRQPARDGEEWTLAHAALLSLGYVMRDAITTNPAAPRYWGLVDAVIAAGARIAALYPIRDSHTERYVHKAPVGMRMPRHGGPERPRSVVQPYEARILLGGLASDTTLLALGQARHVGGGLLVPIDLPSLAVEGLLS